MVIIISLSDAGTHGGSMNSYSVNKDRDMMASVASQTQPTPARIAFSITHGVHMKILKEIHAGVGWVWLARLE